MKYYVRKIDGEKAEQVIEITDKNTFSDIYFIELGSGYHEGFLINEYEVGKQVPRRNYKKYGFKRFKPCEEYIAWRLGEIADNEKTSCK